MNESKISVRYAKALFQTAAENGLDKLVLDNLNEVTGSFEAGELKVFLNSPIIKKSEKKKVFRNVFGNRVNELTMKFLELLLVHNREQYLVRIARYYKKLYNESKGIKEAELSFPVAINKEQSDRILSILKETYKTDIKLNTHIKPEIIGGFILKVDDEQYDASVRNSLKRMKESLSLN